ncbi:MAG: 3-hydroxybutyryl-CoA dehydrogenase [Myxococcales bacterium]|nr:3-hydroxybutyryl-CoA dehydrogenase [Myxococcales bacterium]
MSIGSVGVVGCGQMGLGIVEVVASAGYAVTALKATPGDLEKVKARVAKSLDRRVDKGKLERAEADAILGRITITLELADLRDCDLVIESALEEMDTKAKLLRELEDVMTNGAILASNTSSLPLLKLADSLRRPEQFLALHFFNPAQVMKLVELGVTDRTAPGVVAAAKTFCQSIGKTAVEVSASPGYVVNRLLVPYLLHAIETLEEGVADAPAVDAAMQLGCNHPIGPLALADLIGLDVVMAMATTLQRELADSRYRVPSLLRRLVADQQLGRKSGIGLYDYRGKEPVTNPALRPIAEAAE